MSTPIPTHGDEETTTHAVVRTVAALAGKRPDDLPPLGEEIDADALDSMFLRSSGATALSIIYAGYRIEVTAETVTTEAIPSA